MTDEPIYDMQLRAAEVLERKRAAAPELYAALEAAEWSGLLPLHDAIEGCCPCCEALDDLKQHRPGCPLAAALAKAEGREVSNG